MRSVALAVVIALFTLPAAAQQYRGNTGSQYDPDSIHNPYGQYGSRYSSDSIRNPYGTYGSPYSNYSPNNPYATQPPKLYDSQGNYRGRLSSNPYLPDSTANPYNPHQLKNSNEVLDLWSDD